jgi:hypothetical protein
MICILVYSNDQILATIPISTASNKRTLLGLKLIKTIFLFFYNRLKRLGMLLLYVIYSKFSFTFHNILEELSKKNDDYILYFKILKIILK